MASRFLSLSLSLSLSLCRACLSECLHSDGGVGPHVVSQGKPAVSGLLREPDANQ